MQETFKKIFENNLALIHKEELETDLTRLFDESVYKVLELGEVEMPTGQVVVGDPLCYMGTDCVARLQETIPPGRYKVKVSVLEDSVWGTRYLGAKLQISSHPVQKYRLAVNKAGSDLKAGFGVDTGLACFCDRQVEQAFVSFLDEWHRNNPGKNHYNDYFENEFAKSYKEHPVCQREDGDWLNWQLPHTEENIVMFCSGFGDGFYQAYWGYDASERACCLVVLFIDPRAFDEPLPEPTPRKKYYPIPGGIQKLVPDTQGCIATNRITVEGCKVGYMYREASMEDGDSGWCFMSGDETQAYLDDLEHSGVYTTNEIANYDRDIIPYLEAPIGSAYYRGKDDKFHKER